MNESKKQLAEQAIKSFIERHYKYTADWLNLKYYVFPKCFGSTAGPFGGVGGQMISEFDIEVFVDKNTDIAALFCCDRLWKVVESFILQANWKTS